MLGEHARMAACMREESRRDSECRVKRRCDKWTLGNHRKFKRGRDEESVEWLIPESLSPAFIETADGPTEVGMEFWNTESELCFTHDIEDELECVVQNCPEDIKKSLGVTWHSGTEGTLRGCFSVIERVQRVSKCEFTFDTTIDSSELCYTSFTTKFQQYLVSGKALNTPRCFMDYMFELSLLCMQLKLYGTKYMEALREVNVCNPVETGRVQVVWHQFAFLRLFQEAESIRAVLSSVVFILMTKEEEILSLLTKFDVRGIVNNVLSQGKYHLTWIRLPENAVDPTSENV
jgi:hypothetical protein